MISIPLGELFYPLYCTNFFLLGLFFGSFFNVCIYRLPMGISVNNPKRSFCYRCGTMIRWYDNIPILSYLLLRGRCRSCGVSFSARYMLIEFLTGLMFLAVFVGANPPGSETFQLGTLWYVAFASLLLIGTFTDLDHYIIPEEITIGGTIAALVAALLIGIVDPWPLLAVAGPLPTLRLSWHQEAMDIFFNLLSGPLHMVGARDPNVFWWEPLANSVMGAAFGFGLLWSIGVVGKVVFQKDAMGFGDVKLFAMIGATLGIGGCLVTLMLASFFGVLDGLRGMIVNAMSREGAASHDLFPEVPSNETPQIDPEPDRVAMARLIEIVRNSPRGRKVHYLPFGPSIALAAILVVIFQHRIFY